MRNFAVCTILAALLAVQPVCAQEVATIPLQPSATAPPPPASAPGVLPKGIEIRFVLLDSVSSATATKGQTVHFAVAQDVKVKEIVVIPRGAPAEGIVEHVRKGIPGKQDGELRIEPRQILLNDGSRLKLSRNSPGEDDCGDMGPCWALLPFAIVFVPCAAAFVVIGSPWLIHDWIKEAKKPHTKPQIAGDDIIQSPCDLQNAYTVKPLTVPFSAAQPGPGAESPIKDQLASCPAH